MTNPEMLIPQRQLLIIDSVLEEVTLQGFKRNADDIQVFEPDHSRAAFFEELMVPLGDTPAEEEDLVFVMDAYIGHVQDLALLGLTAADRLLSEHEITTNEDDLYKIACHVGGKIVGHEAMQGTMNIAQWIDIQNGSPRQRKVSHLLRIGDEARVRFTQDFTRERFGDEFAASILPNPGEPSEIMTRTINSGIVEQKAQWDRLLAAAA